MDPARFWLQQAKRGRKFGPKCSGAVVSRLSTNLPGFHSVAPPLSHHPLTDDAASDAGEAGWFAGYVAHDRASLAGDGPWCTAHFIESIVESFRRTHTVQPVLLAIESVSTSSAFARRVEAVQEDVQTFAI